MTSLVSEKFLSLSVLLSRSDVLRFLSLQGFLGVLGTVWAPNVSTFHVMIIIWLLAAELRAFMLRTTRGYPFAAIGGTSMPTNRQVRSCSEDCSPPMKR